MTKLKSIQQLHRGRYRVELVALGDGPSASFVFSVQDGDIQIVQSPPDFVEHMKHRMAPAAALMEAILAFHRAQDLKFQLT